MNDGSMTIPESSLTVVDVDRPEMASAVNELMLLMQAVTEHYSMCIHSATSELLKKVQNSDPIDSAAGIQMREEFDEKILDAAITLDGHRLWLLDEIRNLEAQPQTMECFDLGFRMN